MKKTNFLILTFLVISLTTTYSQVKEVLTSSTIELQKKSTTLNEIIIGDNGYYVFELNYSVNKFLEIAKGEYLIHRFNKNLEYENCSSIKIPFHSNKSKIIHINLRGGNIKILASEIIHKERKENIFLYAFDPTTLKQIGERELILESNFKRGTLLTNGRYSIVNSLDDDKILIYKQYSLKKQNRLVKYLVLDSKSNLISKGEYFVEKEDKKYTSITNGVIINSGDIFFLRKDRMKNKKVNFSIVEISKTSPKGKELIVGLNENDAIITSLGILALDDETILVTGYFADKNIKFTNGIAYASLPPPYTKANTGLIRFSKEDAKMKEKKTIHESMLKYELRDFFVNDKGNLITIGERVNVKTYLDKDKKEYNGYEFENIIINESDFNENTILNTEKIKKRQEYRTNKRQNFYYQETDSELVFIFNNNSKNRNIKEKRKAKKTGNLFSIGNFEVNISRLDTDNILTTKPFLSIETRQKKLINPLRITQLSANEIILLNLFKSKFSLIKYKL